MVENHSLLLLISPMHQKMYVYIDIVNKNHEITINNFQYKWKKTKHHLDAHRYLLLPLTIILA